jgi:hypothetical protein
VPLLFSCGENKQEKNMRIMKEAQLSMKNQAKENLKDNIKSATKNLKTDCDCARQKINLLLQITNEGQANYFRRILIGVEDYCKKVGSRGYKILEDCYDEERYLKANDIRYKYELETKITI